MERVAREKVSFVEVQRKIFEQDLHEAYFQHYEQGICARDFSS